ncbi:intradiol ring-cleavage dioxygenase [Saccharothrix algeriensis]|uniref:3,4-dioxygenase subunit beta n=2 Tax=Catellatospora bangladeshensis TaxID=310355 RepID=A0A8J3J8Y2_9ACTN|nr:3,4-dioxygenase subunit beta [Catellatospora bangladeshensis]
MGRAGRSGRQPAYEGRPLARPQEEVFDQGLGFDIGTLLGRRQLLRGLGLGIAGAGLAACGSSPAGTSSTGTTASGEIPDETAGPYPGDGSNGPDVLEQSGVVRSDIRSSFGTGSATAEGVPMTLELTVEDLAGGGAYAGAAVYVWHCDRDGGYSMYSDGIIEENYLRGVQIADAQGRVRFTSIFPACYSGRWPHVHFEVYPDRAALTDAAKAVATSQVALPADVCETVYATAGYEQSVSTFAQVSLDSDNVFGDDGGASQLGAVSGDVGSGYTVSLTVGVDTGTAPAGGAAPGGGPGGAPPSGPPPTSR